jgi:hypothetical protein
VIAALSYYHGKFADGVKTKREQRVALRQSNTGKSVGGTAGQAGLDRALR